MEISPQDVEKIAQLSRLKFSDEEKQKFSHELTDILNYVDKIKSLGEQKVTLVDDPDGLNLMRDDVAEPVEDVEKFLSQAPAREGKFVKVKSVLD